MSAGYVPLTMSKLPMPPEPRTVADMIPVRQAELAARKAPKCTRDKRHGAMVSHPLEDQTYEVMYCGVWYECRHEGCSGNSHWLSRELAAYHGEPYAVDGESAFEQWDGEAWQPISQEAAYAWWNRRKAEQESQRQAEYAAAAADQIARLAAKTAVHGASRKAAGR